MSARLNQTKISMAVLMISSAFVLSGCGQLLEKLRGGGDAGSDAAAADDDSGATADTSDAAADNGDASAEAGATTVTFHPGDQIPTFNADNAAAAKEINSQNYKTQLVTLDQQVKALK
jgi:hypothetical protein